VRKICLGFFLTVVGFAVLTCAPTKPKSYLVVDHMTTKYGGAGKYGFKFYVFSPGCDIEKAKAIAKYEAYEREKYLFWRYVDPPDAASILPNEMTFFIYTNSGDYGKRSADFIAGWSKNGDTITAR